MKGKTAGELNGFLDRGSTYRGELEFEDTMRIDGRFAGKITSKNELIIGETATIDADIHVGRVAISGTVMGKILCGSAHRDPPQRKGFLRPGNADACRGRGRDFSGQLQHAGAQTRRCSSCRQRRTVRLLTGDEAVRGHEAAPRGGWLQEL